MASSCIGSNVARLRRDREFTQAKLAQRAGVSRVTVGKIERGEVVPHAGTLDMLAKVLGVSVGELVTPVRHLASVRFRARKRVHAREHILAQVAMWLDAYCTLEEYLDTRRQFEIQLEDKDRRNAPAAAQAARRAVGLGSGEPVQDICGLLERYGVKVLSLETKRDSFFGLSVGEADGGPAVVVNTWDRISVERWIFTAAHELGHLLLHSDEYPEISEESDDAEREADSFASHFLMPEEAFGKAWKQTEGLSLLPRILKVKRMFRVSYKTVLYRLVESGRRPKNVWAVFQIQYRRYFGSTLKSAEDPAALTESEFAWNWGCPGEPDRLSRHDFVEDRLSWLVRRAVEERCISLGRSAEILGLSLDQMRQRARDWSIA